MVGVVLVLGPDPPIGVVSRQLVYLHFENRARLLVAAGAAARPHEWLRRPGHRSAGTATGRGLRGAPARLVSPHSGDPPGRSRLQAASIAGDDGSEACADRMPDIREALRIEIARIEVAGRLAPGWTVEQPADWAMRACTSTPGLTWSSSTAGRRRITQSG
jgi:hypothetical protein